MLEKTTVEKATIYVVTTECGGEEIEKERFFNREDADRRVGELISDTILWDPFNFKIMTAPDCICVHDKKSNMSVFHRVREKEIIILD